MVRLFSISVATVIFSSLLVSHAVAQRDAGAKARGEFGHAFMSPSHGRSSHGRSSHGRSYDRSYYNEPASRSTDGYRRFSYEPTEIETGDKVVVTSDSAELMKGSTVVGTVQKGQKLKVRKVIRGWLAAQLEQDGKTLNGWIWHKNVALEEQSQPSFPEAASRDDTDQRSYRRFSFQPSPRIYRSRVRSKPGWAYQKMDPRRYRPR